MEHTSEKRVFLDDYLDSDSIRITTRRDSMGDNFLILLNMNMDSRIQHNEVEQDYIPLSPGSSSPPSLNPRLLPSFSDYYSPSSPAIDAFTVNHNPLCSTDSYIPLLPDNDSDSYLALLPNTDTDIGGCIPLFPDTDSYIPLLPDTDDDSYIALLPDIDTSGGCVPLLPHPDTDSYIPLSLIFSCIPISFDSYMSLSPDSFSMLSPDYTQS